MTSRTALTLSPQRLRSCRLKPSVRGSADEVLGEERVQFLDWLLQSRRLLRLCVVHPPPWLFPECHRSWGCVEPQWVLRRSVGEVLTSILRRDAELSADRQQLRCRTEPRSLSSHAQLVARIKYYRLLKARYALQEAASNPCAYDCVEVPEWDRVSREAALAKRTPCPAIAFRIVAGGEKVSDKGADCRM